MNPLFMQDILEQIFGFFEPKDINNSRLVCRAWNAALVGVVRKRTILKIKCTSSALTWKTLDQDFQYEGQQFQRFELDLIAFRSRDNMIPLDCPNEDVSTFRNMYNFWGHNGRFITDMKVKMGNIFDVEEFKKVIFEYTPNLEKLNLFLILIDNDDNDQPDQRPVEDDRLSINLNMKHFKMTSSSNFGIFPVSLEFLLRRYPNLEKLSLKVDSQTLFASMVTYYEQREGDIPLRILNIGNNAEFHMEALLRLLGIEGLRLRGLKLCFNSVEFEDHQNSAFRRVMELQGDYLESFHLSTMIHSSTDFPFRDRSFAHLTRLVLDGSLTANFRFLMLTPFLTILHIRDNPWIKMPDDEDVKIIGQAPLLKEFYFKNGTFISGPVMQRFTRMMPNVVRFYGFINTAAFIELSRRWLALTRLVIDHYYNDSLDIEEDFLGDQAITNITSLSILETFKILRVGRIGDASIKAVAKLAKLRTLRMKPWNKTTDAYKELQNKFPGFDSTEQDETRWLWW